MAASRCFNSVKRLLVVSSCSGQAVGREEGAASSRGTACVGAGGGLPLRLKRLIAGDRRAGQAEYCSILQPLISRMDATWLRGSQREA